jgi:hypothetical protein
LPHSLKKGGWEKKEKWVRIGWGCGRNGDEFWVFSVLAFISRRIFDMSKRESRAEQSIRAHAPNRRTTHCSTAVQHTRNQIKKKKKKEPGNSAIPPPFLSTTYGLSAGIDPSHLYKATLHYITSRYYHC